MFTNILLPLSLFIIIQIYIFCLDMKITEEIITNDDNKITNYFKLMKSKGDVTILMILLITFYSFFGKIFTIF